MLSAMAQEFWKLVKKTEMTDCFFVSDLHGKIELYDKLFKIMMSDEPDLVLLGGDLFPSGTVLNRKYDQDHTDFTREFLIPRLDELKIKMSKKYPLILIIMGNDDPRSEERKLLEGEDLGLWKYIHKRKIYFRGFKIYGYANIPPSPFLLKDWERFDVSHYVDVGCISPHLGYRTVKQTFDEIDYYTIEKELEILTEGDDLFNAVMLFHAPPYETNLDRAALDGKMVDHVPMDLHIGSIAIKKIIERKQPYLSLHGHVHESTRITGSWQDKIGKTLCLSAAHDGKELALVRFKLESLEFVERILL